MPVKIKDIAKKLNISVGTVSKGLNGASDISYDLTQLILDTAIEMGYKPKKMLNGNSKKLCIFITNMDYKSKNDFGYDIILGFKKCAIRDNWKVYIEEINHSFQEENNYDKYMLAKGYSGAFFVGFALDDLWLQNLSKTTTPTVLLDNYIPKNFNVSYVGTDNFEAFDILIDYLVSIGHSKIGFFSGFLDSMVSSERYDAFLKAMKNHNLNIDKNLICFGHYSIDSAEYHIPNIIKNNATAILCGSDLMAYGAIKVCEKMGINVPNDISIIGFDDIDICKKSTPKITTIKQNRLEIGKCAYISLEGIMRNVCINKTTLRPKLIKRNSVKKII
ncbi:LacI family DNA-binding transcriptional regulator [[Clostridium] colinum]|uniref:LacI family DNA-binding transcriptional regulator n=1 Tax=[Clostridium] colinum TaxID=36835 RepID=UPI00202478DE|nr:LacI family DNA-binding transcriptional regulator [[Clostridium] colinum]